MANSTVLPLAATSRMVVQNWCRPSTSIATVGSSSTSRSELETSATANRARWVWPPDSLLVRRSAKSPIPVSSITSSTASAFGYSEATERSSSRTVR